MENIDIQDKVRGSIVGGAIGDALGYPVEFIYSFDNIEKRYGQGGIKDYDLGRAWIGEDGNAQFSDDTQMTLYTAEGLLYALDHGMPVLPVITDSYLYWYAGQSGCKITDRYPSQLVAIAELSRNRAPGTTCMSSLRTLLDGKILDNNSKGCGGIMRIAPIALYGATHGWELERTATLAGDVARITHLHPLSTLSSACTAAIIQQCVTRTDSSSVVGFRDIVGESLDCVERVYASAEDVTHFKQLVLNAISACDDPRADWQVIESSLGEGWVAEETLAIALFSVLRHIGSFADCLVCAVNHGGDSDSTGAVAGNIIGAILGYKAIPARYLNGIQLRKLLEDFADRLVECVYTTGTSQTKSVGRMCK